MKFHYFGGSLHSDLIQIVKLEESHFDGVLFTYNPYQGDVFVPIARNLKTEQKIKYMVAIRPHTMSAQYLCAVNQAFNNIQKDRLQINIIAGHIKPNEIDFNGIIGEITDYSSVKDRTNYLIEYIKELKGMEENKKVQIPDYYVSCTNIYSFTIASELKQKIILPYAVYKNKYFLDTDIPGKAKPGADLNITDQKIMLAVSPVIRETQQEIDDEFPKNKTIHTYDGGMYIDRERATIDTEYFTYSDFIDFIKNLEINGINEVLVNSDNEPERERLIYYVKKYIEEFH